MHTHTLLSHPGHPHTPYEVHTCKNLVPGERLCELVDNAREISISEATRVEQGSNLLLTACTSTTNGRAWEKHRIRSLRRHEELVIEDTSVVEASRISPPIMQQPLSTNAWAIANGKTTHISISVSQPEVSSSRRRASSQSLLQASLVTQRRLQSTVCIRD